MAIRAAYLIAEYDQLVSTILTARHLGLISRPSGEQLIRRGTRLVRRVLDLPLGWRPLAITRADVRANNERAQRARTQLGDLPEEILSGTCRANIVPAMRLAFGAGKK